MANMARGEPTGLLEYGCGGGQGGEYNDYNRDGDEESCGLFMDYARKAARNRRDSGRGRGRGRGRGGARGGRGGAAAAAAPPKRRASTGRAATPPPAGARAAAVANVRRMSASEIGQLESKFGSKVKDAVPSGYHLVRKLGEGAFGLALQACRGAFECLCIKLQIVQDDKLFNHEVAMQRKFAAIGLSPQVLDVKTWNHKGKRIAAIVMTKIDGILSSFFAKEQPQQALDQLLWWVVDAIKRMCTAKLTHGDMHWDNMAYVLEVPDGDEKGDEEFVPVAGGDEDEDEFTATRAAVVANEPRGARFALKPLLIDFGWASNVGCFPELELIQNLRTASRRYNKKMPTSTERYLQDNLYLLFTNNYHKIKKNQEAYENEWGKLMDKQVAIVERIVRGGGRRRRSSGGRR